MNQGKFFKVEYSVAKWHNITNGVNSVVFVLPVSILSSLYLKSWKICILGYILSMAKYGRKFF